MWIALVVVILCTGMMVALLDVGLSAGRERVSRSDKERAFQIAEAALAESLESMRRGQDGIIAERDVPATFSGGACWVDVEEISTAIDRVTAAGMFGGARVGLSQLVFSFDPDPGVGGIFADRSIIVNSQGLVDSFNANLGTYASQVIPGEGHAGVGSIVQSNGDIMVDSSTEIWGEVHSGPTGSLKASSSSFISGPTESMPVERTLAPVTVPGITSGGSLTVSTPTVLGPGDIGLDSLTLATGSQLVITGPARLLVNDFSLRSNASLIIDTSAGGLEFYTTGSFSLASNSEIVTLNQAAADCTFYFAGGPSQDIAFKSNSEFYGTIYAPEAMVSISSNFEIFGAITAAELDLAANVRLHFDESLMSASDEERLYIPGRWETVTFPDDVLRTKRGDAFAVLGVDFAALPTLAEAVASP